MNRHSPATSSRYDPRTPTFSANSHDLGDEPGPNPWGIPCTAAPPPSVAPAPSAPPSPWSA
ncbi:hypothetical protein DEJ06_12425 [Curtobacterium sp. MCLR17_051]|nr:hypothetical protein DEI98_12575 [Curtobacterium sp. MCLR17_034]PZF39683.1 hypothetical protein DEJ07_12110 [Curtobacterium sp. MCLR17_053]PZF48854.1 hypothetical protein DEJ06_12425 [Curtobacterium sp. MCLR17_051]